MIYSIYKESTVAKKPETVDYFAESVDSGIQIPQGLTSSQFDAFVAGIAESAMLTCFEKIGIAESMYFTEAEEAEAADEETAAKPSKGKVVWEAIKGMFGKLLEVAKNFFGGIISWFGDRIKNFKDQFTKEGNFRILEKDLINPKYTTAADRIILKTKLIAPNNEKGENKLQKNTYAYYQTNIIATKLEKLAKDIKDGKDNFADDAALSKAAFTAAGFSDVSSIKDFKKAIVDKYTGEYEITYSQFGSMWPIIKEYVLNGSQKKTIKNIYNDYKKTLNGILNDLKQDINKDNKGNMKSRIAKIKDVILVQDTYGRTIANLEQKRYLEAMAMAVNGIKAIKSNSKADDKAYEKDQKAKAKEEKKAAKKSAKEPKEDDFED